MTLEILAVLLLVLSAAILFWSEAVRVDVVAILILVSLALSAIVTPEEALSGFSNPATATVAAMFVLSEGLRRTGVVSGVAALLRRTVGRRPAWLYVSLLVASGLVSAFINNTAAVAVLIPVVLGLCRSSGQNPRRYLMPLSFAAQVGGVCTLIGTSTNILVSDLAVRAGRPPFGMFEFSALGLCFAGAALLYLWVVAPFLLRRHADETEPPLLERYRVSEYLAELEVPEGSPLVGKTLAEAGLEATYDIEILEILRERVPRWLPDPVETLATGDVLLVRGSIARLLESRASGLRIPQEVLKSEGQIQMMEAVVPPASPLAGRTLDQSRFQRQHRVTALAIRHHERLRHSRVGRMPLSVGDILLLQGPRAELEALRNGPELILMEEIEPVLPRGRSALIALAIIVAVVGFAALGIAPILVTAVAGATALVLTRILTVEQVYEAIDWKVVFLLAGVIPLGIALERTGAAALLAGLLTSRLGALGPLALLSGLYLLTALLTEVMSNNATAALLAPLAIASAEQMGIDSRPLLVALTFAASTSFMTPVGYQTNAMVQGPGRYAFSDFARVGAPLNVIFWILGTLLIPSFFPF